VSFADFCIQDVTGQLVGSRSEFILFVSGSTDSIKELVRGSDNYRVKVWFTNLRSNGGDTVSADVQKIEIIKVQ